MSRRRTTLPSPTGDDVRVNGGVLGLSALPDDADETEAPASTRERILNSAELLFAEHGFDRVTMPMIATASGITAGAIYKHFDSKSDLFFEMVRGVVRSSPPPAAEWASDEPMLPRLIATYTTSRARLLRQLAVEIHYASAKDSGVRALLRRSLDDNVEQIRDGVASLQRSGKLDQTVDPQSVARVVLVFVMGLMHMDTLLPDLVGDAKWQGFVQERVAALIGLIDSKSGAHPATD